MELGFHGEPPLATIFLPTHARNASGLLSRAIESVLAQTERRFELLIVDDGSVDGSRETIERYAARDSRVRHIRYEKNIGLPALTCGLALESARGEYIGWCFDDSTLAADHLETLSAALAAEPRTAMVYGQTEVFVPGGKCVVFGEPLDLERLRAGDNHIGNPGVLFRRSVVDDVGWLDPNVLLKRVCDWDLWIRIAERHPVRFVERIVAREHGLTRADSLGNDFVGMDLDLLHRYVRNDRSALLRPDRLRTYDPFLIEHAPNLDENDRRIFLNTLNEHFVKTLDIAHAVEVAERSPADDWRVRVRAQNPEITDERLLLLMESAARCAGYREAWLKQQMLQARRERSFWVSVTARVWHAWQRRRPR